MLRRRATETGRYALGASINLPHVDTARYVLSTRHGELQRTLSILDTLFDGEEISPTDFGMSVHHGLTGLLSIATKNSAGHSAVTGGLQSFCYSLMEAAACLHETPDQPVILLHYDEALSYGLEALEIDGKMSNGPMVLALDLTNPEAGEGTLLATTMRPATSAGAASDHLADFLAFLCGSTPSATSTGLRQEWEWRRV